MSPEFPESDSNVVKLSTSNKKPKFSINIQDSVEKIETILWMDSIETLISHQKYAQFRELSFFHLVSASDSKKRIILQAIKNTMNNIILDKIKKEPPMMAVIFIQRLDQELRLFSQQLERDFDFIFFSDEYTTEINNLFAESISNYLYLQSGDVSEKYKDIVCIYSNLSSQYEHMDWFSLYPETVKSITSNYFNDVFKSLLALGNYDSLSSFCMSDDGFKKELDIDYIKLKLFKQIKITFEWYTSQHQAKDLKHCIESLCRFFEETDQEFFMLKYLPEIEDIFLKLPEFDNLVQFPWNN